MRKDPNDILVAELKKLATEASGKEIGAGAVSWVARKMPNDAFQTSFSLPTDPEAVLTAAWSVLQEKGRIEEDVDTPVETANISGVVGSGFLGMNPAVVTVHVMPRDDGGTDVLVTGVAKEGMIKQRGGEKAAKAVADRIKEKVAS